MKFRCWLHNFTIFKFFGTQDKFLPHLLLLRRVRRILSWSYLCKQTPLTAKCTNPWARHSYNNTFDLVSKFFQMGRCLGYSISKKSFHTHIQKLINNQASTTKLFTVQNVLLDLLDQFQWIYFVRRKCLLVCCLPAWDKLVFATWARVVFKILINRGYSHCNFGFPLEVTFCMQKQTPLTLSLWTVALQASGVIASEVKVAFCWNEGQGLFVPANC